MTKKLIISGTVEEVKKIIDSLIYQHGRKAIIQDVMNKYNKEVMFLS